MISADEAKAQLATMDTDDKAEALMLAAAIFSEHAESSYFAAYPDGSGARWAAEGRAEARDLAGKLRYTARLLAATHQGGAM